MNDDIRISGPRAARLTALSREARDQSVAAIRQSLRLLRQPAYPADRPTSEPLVQTEPNDAAEGGLAFDRLSA